MRRDPDCRDPPAVFITRMPASLLLVADPPTTVQFTDGDPREDDATLHGVGLTALPDRS